MLLGLTGIAALYLEGHKESIQEGLLASDFSEDTAWVRFAKPFGDARNLLGGAALVYSTGLFAGMPKVRETGLILGEALVASGVTTGLLQTVLAEERPQEGGTLRFLQTGGHGASGHASGAMTLVRVLDHQLLRLRPGEGKGPRLGKISAKAALYSVSAATAWQRIRENRHYLWNVVAGAGAALYTTNALLRAHESLTPEQPRRLPLLSVAPAGQQGGAILLTWELP
jgi:hypothetical protein